MSELKLYYFFDPLCGWCYASAPALTALAETYSTELTLMPAGLFSGEGARAISPEWADYAWRNDQRIEQLTGQVFTTAYYNNVLHGDNVQFDSGPATKAMTLVKSVDPQVEFRLLDLLQKARYVEGLDTANPQTVAHITATLLADFGVEPSVELVAEQLIRTPSLTDTTHERLRQTQQYMQRSGITSVPLLLLHTNGYEFILQGADLYSGASRLLNAIQQLVINQRKKIN